MKMYVFDSIVSLQLAMIGLIAELINHWMLTDHTEDEVKAKDANS